MRAALVLASAAVFGPALPGAAFAQTVQLVNQPFPVTTIGQTSMLALPLNIGNAGTVAGGNVGCS